MSILSCQACDSHGLGILWARVAFTLDPKGTMPRSMLLCRKCRTHPPPGVTVLAQDS